MDRYEMTLYISDKRIEDFMEVVDLKPEYKCFISSVQKVKFTYDKKLNTKFFMDIIEKSRKDKKFWIPMIEFCGYSYIADGIKELSNGGKVLFVRGGYNG